jgi:hypothetical protein
LIVDDDFIHVRQDKLVWICLGSSREDGCVDEVTWVGTRAEGTSHIDRHFSSPLLYFALLSFEPSSRC